MEMNIRLGYDIKHLTLLVMVSMVNEYVCDSPLYIIMPGQTFKQWKTSTLMERSYGIPINTH